MRRLSQVMAIGTGICMMMAGCSREGTPEYALEQLIGAAAADDQLGFDAYSDAESLTPKSQGLLRKSLRAAEDVSGLREVEDKAEAKVLIRDPYLDETIPLRVRLVRREGSWAVNSVDEVAWYKERLGRCEGRLPEIQERFREEMGKLVEVGDFTRKEETTIIGSKRLDIWTPYINRSTRPIGRIEMHAEYVIDGESKRGEVDTAHDVPDLPMVRAFPIDEEPLAPGDTLYARLYGVADNPVGPDSPVYHQLRTADLEEAELRFVVDEIKYTDGTSTRVPLSCHAYAQS